MPFDRITRDPELMNGQACVRGMRLTVRRVLEIVATTPDRSEVHRDYAELEDEAIARALGHAAATMDDARVELRRDG